jgi:hypothetical protein
MTSKDLQHLVNYINTYSFKDTKEYYNEETCECEIKAVIDFNDLMSLLSRYPVDDLPGTQPKIAYLCDRLYCGDNCSYPLCSHTTNIVHAKNFKVLSCDGNAESRYIEEGCD